MKTFLQTAAFIALFTMLSFTTLDMIVCENNGAKFLSDAADARMMDYEEGRLAVEKGTTDEIKSYGKIMVKDQSVLLGEIKKIAANKKVMLPSEISDEKTRVLSVLKGKTGKDFDKKFLRMIKIDHQRDIKEFQNAAECDDKEIKSFALQYLPMIEGHLAGVEKIKEEE